MLTIKIDIISRKIKHRSFYNCKIYMDDKFILAEPSIAKAKRIMSIISEFVDCNKIIIRDGKVILNENFKN